MPLPTAMPPVPPVPPVLARAPLPEIDNSAALSIFALPGTVGVQTRLVAIWIADGVDAKQANMFFSALRSAGANPRMLGPRIGKFTGLNGSEIEAVASLETEPAVVFDGMVFPSGSDKFFKTFASDGRAGGQQRDCDL
jgi:catalase